MAGAFGNETNPIMPLVSGALGDISNLRAVKNARLEQDVGGLGWAAPIAKTRAYKARNPLVGALHGSMTNYFNPETQQKVKMSKAAREIKDWMKTEGLDPVKDQEKILEKTASVATDLGLMEIGEKATAKLTEIQSAKVAAEMEQKKFGLKEREAAQKDRQLTQKDKELAETERYHKDYVAAQRLAAQIKQTPDGKAKQQMITFLNKETVKDFDPSKVSTRVAQKITDLADKLGGEWTGIDVVTPGDAEYGGDAAVQNTSRRVSQIINQLTANAPATTAITDLVDPVALENGLLAAELIKHMQENRSSSNPEKDAKKILSKLGVPESDIAKYMGLVTGDYQMATDGTYWAKDESGNWTQLQ